MSTLKHVLEIIDLLEKPNICGGDVLEFFREKGLLEYMDIYIERIESEKGYTDFIKITIPRNRSSGPVLGIIGRLGGLGARPEYIGLVSDADGAIVALASAYKIAEYFKKGESLEGSVIVSTHICPRALVLPYKPATMITSPVELYELVKREVDERMNTILSIDATKANMVIKQYGFAITPTVKDGWILRVSPDLINIYVRVTGEQPLIVPITMQDLLPYTTKVYHINSIIQPWLYTSAPVVGVATVTRQVVSGDSTGATDIYVLEKATRFIVEVYKDYGSGKARFYDEDEWRTINTIHGSVREIMARGFSR